MQSSRTDNIFGAVALAASDMIRSAAAVDVPRGGATAAALSLIGHVAGLSIDQLARGLGLSHPGAVRLVDGLASEGLVSRKSSTVDRRSVELRLTAAGMRKRRALLSARRAALADFIAPLDATERAQLDGIAAKLLRAHVTSIPDALATCRFCDERACTDCPVNEALEASGSFV